MTNKYPTQENVLKVLLNRRNVPYQIFTAILVTGRYHIVVGRYLDVPSPKLPKTYIFVPYIKIQFFFDPLV